MIVVTVGHLFCKAAGQSFALLRRVQDTDLTIKSQSNVNYGGWAMIEESFSVFGHIEVREVVFFNTKMGPFEEDIVGDASKMPLRGEVTNGNELITRANVTVSPIRAVTISPSASELLSAGGNHRSFRIAGSKVKSNWSCQMTHMIVFHKHRTEQRR